MDKISDRASFSPLYCTKWKIHVIINELMLVAKYCQLARQCCRAVVIYNCLMFLSIIFFILKSSLCSAVCVSSKKTRERMRCGFFPD